MTNIMTRKHFACWVVLTLLVLLWAIDVYTFSQAKHSAVQQQERTEAEVQAQVPSKLALLNMPLPAPPSPQAQNEVDVVQQQQYAQVSDAQISHTMQRLLELDGASLSLALPNNAVKRERLLQYLYRCEQINFAVYHSKNGALQVLSDNSTEQASELMRVVSGGLSRYEQQLLSAYAVSGQAVRIFNRDMDWRLSEHIGRALQKNPLQSLRARYELTNKGVHLTDITLNQHMLNTTWRLSQGNCRAV